MKEGKRGGGRGEKGIGSKNEMCGVFCLFVCLFVCFFIYLFIYFLFNLYFFIGDSIGAHFALPTKWYFIKEGAYDDFFYSLANEVCWPQMSTYTGIFFFFFFFRGEIGFLELLS